MKKYPIRTRFGDIVCEFLPPARKSRKVLIICGGMPGMPRHGALLELFARNGYWTFYPRYRGSWESGGKFLKISPEKDVLDLVKGLSKGFRDLYSGERYRVAPEEVYVVGSSFGGPAALLAARDKRITRVVGISPVIDWRVPGKIESVDWTKRFTKEAFGGAYRFDEGDWKKLKKGDFYNPATRAQEIPGAKALIFQAKDDKVVPYRPAVRFSKEIGAKLALLPRGGHLGLKFILKPGRQRRILKFLKTGK